MKYLVFLTVVIALILAAIAAVPLVLVWVINVLWHTNTAYSVESWTAALLLILILKATIRYKREQ